MENSFTSAVVLANFGCKQPWNHGTSKEIRQMKSARPKECDVVHIALYLRRQLFGSSPTISEFRLCEKSAEVGIGIGKTNRMATTQRDSFHGPAAHSSGALGPCALTLMGPHLWRVTFVLFKMLSAVEDSINSCVRSLR